MLFRFAGSRLSGAVILLITLCGRSAAAQEHGTGVVQLAQDLPLISIAPFLLLLLAIALLPLIVGHWWEHNWNKAIVVACVALPMAVYLGFGLGPAGRFVLEEKMIEYVSFIVLLAALYTISGGIYIQGSLSGTPLVNSGMMAIGAVLANLIGTTGASVVLIRPLLRANKSRRDKVHVVIFFIFVVSNCGGLLTPLGDPPLFLGFLMGVPFEWTLRLWPQWLFVNVALIAIFNIWDQIVLDREERARPGSQLEEAMAHEPLWIHGKRNLVLLAGIMAVVLASGKGIGYGGQPWPFGVKEALMAILAAVSYGGTPSLYHERNSFNFDPIIEVAVLFVGIFVTMAPALVILNAWGQGARDVLGMEFGLHRPWHFFWATGSLSSFLDNAPTYLTFSATAAGLEHVPAEGRFLGEFLTRGEAAVRMLAAISTGAVFMGSMTYIGNGPNFMVKAIAESSGLKMPSFFGYMLYSMAVLLPLFLVVTLLFFRG
ncbi:MAG: sodium:proton antiporter [Gemmatimonadota bacterium]|nr:sodium:proton antiporter [Gemmatimonadota bacterium]MDH4349702.1 sodium:proton antiporter [Gemmatimonadota bacterium]MDH5196694.1 sodium:proton antiporter [Gemmatimonadota bacterium]